ncbi:50S ribosomal protein L23 [Candidatus Annandia pinicola]|uniref:50S ribosomal protein L23 n=1 Tax=Candidatus Annandia pinicola TaxID=1345117 RepID=UPI001D02D8EF|nr:50S ribosomal protein L23 [Candidatus Annandia pinicola]UDG80499.1 50S ribosomal protein L23 [Candidatus Annandia pinicola]
MKIIDKKLYLTLKKPFISQRISFLNKEGNKFIFKTSLKTNKKEIKKAIIQIFNTSLISINTLIVKKKKIKRGKFIHYHKSWKKVYISFKEKIYIGLPNLKITNKQVK